MSELSDREIRFIASRICGWHKENREVSALFVAVDLGGCEWWCTEDGELVVPVDEFKPDVSDFAEVQQRLLEKYKHSALPLFQEEEQKEKK